MIALLLVTPAAAAPLVIAHRGASGDRPEHTIAAYRLAIEQGADFIEPDLVVTKDGVLVARHENEISGTTDVAARPEFASRRTTKTIDGALVQGWFTEDFTLAELKTLRARERLPQLRPANTAFDGSEAIPTFDEVLALVEQTGRRVGIYPEIKHGSYFAKLGLAVEPRLLASLERQLYTQNSDRVFIQSFEVGNLMALRRRTKLRLVQLIGDEGGPADRPKLRYRDMVTPAGLKAIARYADGVGLAKALIVPRLPDGRSGQPTRVVADAHLAGLQVHVWTFRAENYFLSPQFQRGNPTARGDMAGEVRQFVKLGVDGVFTDHPAEAVRALR